MNGLIYTGVIKSIENWEPSDKFTRESDSRDELIKHLRDELNSNPFFGTKTISVTSEDGRGLCDIAVNEREVGIELKNNFNSKAKLDRLIGQVHRYKKDYNDIIIVLVGKTKDNTLDDLRVQISELNKMNNFGSQNIEIINKDLSKSSHEKISKKNMGSPFGSPFGKSIGSPFSK